MRCIGQETPSSGILLQDPSKQEVRERRQITNGLQTPKHSHPETDLYIPLLFWFNTNPAFAISNWNITYGQFWVEIDFESEANCVFVIDYAGDGGLYSAPSILACDLVTNHVYTTLEVAELFKHQTQFSIIRVHKRVERILNKPYDLVNISDIKFAGESLYVRAPAQQQERRECGGAVAQQRRQYLQGDPVRVDHHDSRHHLASVHAHVLLRDLTHPELAVAPVWREHHLRHEPRRVLQLVHSDAVRRGDHHDA